ncbi:hypothetical protein [Streptomyces sp. NRRL B-24720]|uniref:hypothetical protein n=1 Tax=Streptomyces sp. NRRL B-24720 TaxID=1476876 RepID=UPI0004CB7624|nr:hypothetical protein [Streptomyces sp. NRRL B-24720]
MTPIGGGARQRTVRRAACTALLIALMTLVHAVFTPAPVSFSKLGPDQSSHALLAGPTVGAAVFVDSASSELSCPSAPTGRSDDHRWRSGTTSIGKPRHTPSAATAVATDPTFGAEPTATGRGPCAPAPVGRAGSAASPEGLVLRC